MSFSRYWQKIYLANVGLLPAVSDVFTKLSCYPMGIKENDIAMLEKFVVTMYDKSCSSNSVIDVRLDLFARKQK